MMSETQFDIIIIGGGVIGSALACALATLPIRVALVEGKDLRQRIPLDADLRSIGLTLASQQFLKQLGLWTSIKPKAVALNSVYISDKGALATIRLHAQEYELPALGFVVPMPILQHALVDAIEKIDNLTLFSQTKLAAITMRDNLVLAQLHDGNVLQGSLLLAADGESSTVRQLVEIQTQRWDYQQLAIVCNVTFANSNAGIAYERFTDKGPLAVLPHGGQRCGLVWAIKQPHAARVMALANDAFIEEVQAHFGYRLGRLLTVSSRSSYPLAMVRAKQRFAERVVLLGNAAQSVHPVAAQGMNFGLQDVRYLAQLLAQAIVAGEDIGSQTLLQTFSRARKPQQQRLLLLTDGLVRVFSNDFLPLKLSRHLGLLGANFLPGFKRQMINKLAGLS